MFDHHIRTRNWLFDLAVINGEIEIAGLPSPSPRARRARKPRPFWEE